MEKDTLKSEITQFFDYSRDALESFKQINLSQKLQFLPTKKLMCCALLDSLSIGRYGGKSKGTKFRKFIETYSNYQHWNTISLPQLYYKFENNPDPKFSHLKKYVKNTISNKDSYSVDNDSSYEELIQNLSGYEQQIKSCTYLSLLYKYRNHVAHTMREPGWGIEHSAKTEPFYLSLTDHREEKNRFTFQLVYPTGFFFKICEECICNLEAYFLQENKSPYESFNFDDVW